MINSEHFSYFWPNFRKISAQALNFSPEITIHLNLQFSSKYQFKVIGTEILKNSSATPPSGYNKKNYYSLGHPVKIFEKFHFMPK